MDKIIKNIYFNLCFSFFLFYFFMSLKASFKSNIKIQNSIEALLKEEKFIDALNYYLEKVIEDLKSEDELSRDIFGYAKDLVYKIEFNNNEILDEFSKKYEEFAHELKRIGGEERKIEKQKKIYENSIIIFMQSLVSLALRAELLTPDSNFISHKEHIVLNIYEILNILFNGLEKEELDKIKLKNMEYLEVSLNEIFNGKKNKKIISNNFLKNIDIIHNSEKNINKKEKNNNYISEEYQENLIIQIKLDNSRLILKNNDSSKNDYFKLFLSSLGGFTILGSLILQENDLFISLTNRVNCGFLITKSYSSSFILGFIYGIGFSFIFDSFINNKLLMHKMNPKLDTINLN